MLGHGEGQSPDQVENPLAREWGGGNKKKNRKCLLKKRNLDERKKALNGCNNTSH